MDFASLMSKTLSKSSTPTPPPKADSKSPTPPKFISRREAEEARKAAYIAEQQRIEAERAAKANAKRKREEELAEEAKAREEKEAEEERARRRRLGLPEVPPTAQKDEANAKEEDEDLDNEEGDAPSEEEVRAKLRALGEPVALFGETPAVRLKRFRRLTGVVVQPNGPVPTTLPPVEEKDMKVGAVPKPEDKAARRYLYRQLASYFNMVLREWERALAEEGSHDTTAGRQAVSAMLSSKESMKAVCHPLAGRSVFQTKLTNCHSSSANLRRETSTRVSSRR
jgi:pre-mRNA-splicing factor 18